MHVTYANVDSSLVVTLDHDIVITDIGNDITTGADCFNDDQGKALTVLLQSRRQKYGLRVGNSKNV